MHKLSPVGRAAKLLLVFATVGFSLALYLRITEIQRDANVNMGSMDQFAYMVFAKKAYESGYSYTGGRARMPLFPWIQALFYSPEMSDEAFFEQGKQINVLISVAGIAAIGAAFVSKFSKLYASYAIALIAFLCFAIKAPWFQAEILFYVLFAFAFMLAVESIRWPKWYKSIGVGLLFALAHFTKASGLLGIAMYAGSFSVPLLAEIYRRRPNRQGLTRIILLAIAPLVIFAAALFPYFNESKHRYGHYLYNVSTTFYMWYDYWAEAKEGTKAAGDREGWPDMPDEEIPSLTKYLAEHTSAQIAQRFVKGAAQMYKNACGSADGPSQFGLCVHVGIGLLIILSCVYGKLVDARHRPTLKDAQIFVFVASLLSVYSVSFMWFASISSGPRFMLMLLIPLLWSVGLALEAAPASSTSGLKASHYRAVIAVMLVILLSQLYHLVVERAAQLFGGF